MKELSTYRTALDADIDKGFLESQGIGVNTLNATVASVNPMLALGLALGVTLLVKEADMERARQLLNETRT